MIPRALAILLTLAGVVVSARPVHAGEVVTVGTLAPKQSVWGRTFAVWEEAVKKKSDGKLELRVFYNGQQGDDGTMVGKVRSGQLDACAVSAIGLGKAHKPILALQLPGLFRSWEALDRARDAMKDEFEKGAEKEGFRIGWGDLGKLRGMTKGAVIKRPNDLSGKKVLSWRNDVIGPTVYQLIPNVTIVPLSAMEVLPTLRSGGVEVLSAPSLAAEALQWTPHLTHISAESTVMAIGGMVWSKKRIDSLPGDLRTVLEDTGKVMQTSLRKKIRAEDDAAFERLKAKMTVITLSDDDKNAWKPIFVKAIDRLKQGTFDPKLIDRLIEIAKASQ
jgi:TRAP-type C4-dicarboxylate transport system substrate-binding protein